MHTVSVKNLFYLHSLRSLIPKTLFLPPISLDLANELHFFPTIYIYCMFIYITNNIEFEGMDM